MRDIGSAGYNLPSTANVYTNNTTAKVYVLAFSNEDTTTSAAPDARFYGYPLRCLAD